MITVLDTLAPVFTITQPADTSVQCNSIPAPPIIGTQIFAEKCGNSVSIVLAETTQNASCLNTYELVRTWTATDDCGNQEIVSQTIFVSDTIAPIITNVPGVITVECDNIPTGDPTVVTVSDNCTLVGDITVTVSDATTGGSCVNTYTITRTWTATDECNNSSTAVQTINVEDTMPPSITDVPSGVTVECDNIPVGDASAVTVTDNCSSSSDITVVVNDVTTAGSCANTYTITRTWTATDECNNSSTAVQTINVEDTMPPSITDVPSAVTVECDNIPVGDASAVTVTDNCSASSDITVVVNDVTTGGSCANTYTITRTWTATDECNNSSTAVQTINVEDTTPPSITDVPSAVTVECDNIPVSDASAVTVTDNCSSSSDITVVVNDVTTGGSCANTYTITRTWTATDECNNSSTAVQTINVEDTMPPSITDVPSGVTVECDNIPCLLYTSPSPRD